VYVFLLNVCDHAVLGEADLDLNDSGTLVWDPKVVENLTDEECEYIPLSDLSSVLFNENYMLIFSSRINVVNRPNNS